MSAISAVGLVKRFSRGVETVTALAGVDLTVSAGEFVALVGPSGSGKSTLLAVLCGWEVPDEGTLTLEGLTAGRSPGSLSWSELALAPQALGLVADLSLADNVLMPARLRGADETARANRLLSSCDIAHLSDRYPHQVSLGEQQRAAVARALLLNPDVLLADEPTAHQDRAHADQLLDEVIECARAGAAVLVATHDEVAWQRADRVITMRDGRLLNGAPQ